MDNTTELDEFDRNRNDVRVYAAFIKRGSRWTSPGAVARISGLSLAASTSALWRLRRQEVAEWKYQGKLDVFRVLGRGTNSRRAEPDCEARRLRLIAGPRMKPLF